MSAEDSTPAPDDPPADADDVDTDPNDGTGADALPMDKVNQLIAREARKAAKRAERDLLEKLGVGSTDDLAATLQAQRDREAAEQTDLEKAQARAVELERANQETADRLARAELRQQLSEAMATRADGPIRSDRLTLALGIAVEHALTVDAEDDPVASGVEHVASASPEWFGASSDANDDEDDKGGRKTPQIRSKGPADKKPKPKSAAARGAEAAGQFGGTVLPPIPTS